MAQDIGYDFNTGPTITLLAVDLSDDAESPVTAVIDFGSPTPIGFGWELRLTVQTSADSLAFLEIAWAHVNVAAQYSDVNNLETVTSILCVASTDNSKVGATEIKARFAKVRLKNRTGGIIEDDAESGSVTGLLLFDIFYNQV